MATAQSPGMAEVGTLQEALHLPGCTTTRPACRRVLAARASCSAHSGCHRSCRRRCSRWCRLPRSCCAPVRLGREAKGSSWWWPRCGGASYTKLGAAWGGITRQSARWPDAAQKPWCSGAPNGRHERRAVQGHAPPSRSGETARPRTASPRPWACPLRAGPFTSKPARRGFVYVQIIGRFLATSTARAPGQGSFRPVQGGAAGLVPPLSWRDARRRRVPWPRRCSTGARPRSTVPMRCCAGPTSEP